MPERQNFTGDSAKHGASLRLLWVRLTVLGLALTAACFWFGSIRALGMYIQGASVIPEASSIELGERSAGTEIEATIWLRRLSLSKCRLIGLEATCTCISSDGQFPQSLPLFRSSHHDLRIIVPAKAGSFSQSVVLLFDGGHLIRLPIAIRGVSVADHSVHKADTWVEKLSSDKRRLDKD